MRDIPKDLFIEWIVRSNRIDITVITFPPLTNAFQYGYCDNSGIGLQPGIIGDGFLFLISWGTVFFGQLVVHSSDGT